MAKTFRRASRVWTASSRAQGTSHNAATTKLYGQVLIPRVLLVPGFIVNVRCLAVCDAAGGTATWIQQLNFGGTAGQTDGAIVYRTAGVDPALVFGGHIDCDFALRNNVGAAANFRSVADGDISQNEGIPTSGFDFGGWFDAVSVNTNAPVPVKYIGILSAADGTIITPGMMVVKVYEPDETIVLL